MMNMNELGLPDDSLLEDHLDISYSAHRQKIRRIISINLIVGIMIFILSIILTYFFILKQQRPSSVQHPIQSNYPAPTRITPPGETPPINQLSPINKPNIKAGKKFGDIAGFDFDDSLMEKFTMSHCIREIILRCYLFPLHWFQCFYSSPDDPDNLLEGVIHGIREINDTTERFFLDKDEKISKIQIKVDTVQLYQDGIPSFRTRLIMGMRFYTTKGRTSRSIDYVNGQMYSEEFEGYTLGYVTGKSGRYIDQLQFFWYKTL